MGEQKENLLASSFEEEFYDDEQKQKEGEADNGSFDDEFSEPPETLEPKKAFWKSKPAIVIGVIVLSAALVPLKSALFSHKHSRRVFSTQLQSPHNQTPSANTAIPPRTMSPASALTQSSISTQSRPAGSVSEKQKQLAQMFGDTTAPKNNPKQSSVAAPVSAAQSDETQKPGVSQDDIRKMVDKAVKERTNHLFLQYSKNRLKNYKLIHKLTNKVRKLSAGLEKVSIAMKTIDQVQQSVQQPKPKPAGQEVAQKTPFQKQKYPEYWLQAIVPGQAWVVSAQDSTIYTLSKGDELPGNVKILNIDAPRNQVMTSQGLIRFQAQTVSNR